MSGPQESDKLIALARDEAEKHKQLAEWAHAPETRETMKQLQVGGKHHHLHSATRSSMCNSLVLACYGVACAEERSTHVLLAIHSGWVSLPT